MLMCYLDPSIHLDVPESNCTRCCIYCNEKETCDYKCPRLKYWKTEEEIAKQCDCVEEG